MTQQLINVGTVGNDGTGDTARLAWQKGNANFTDLYTQLAAYGQAYVGTFVATAGQTVFTLPLSPGTVANLQISVDGAMMVPGLDYYWTTPVTVTFYVGLKVNQTVLYRYSSVVPIGTSLAGGVSGQVQYNNSGVLNGTTIGGDATLVATTGALTVTKTAGVAFAASATTDTTNAANISSGILPVARQSYTQGGTGSVARTVTNKLQESVSVLDFGADPTGVADSTAAIQAALNSSSCVYIPSGTFIVSNVTLTSNSYIYGNGSSSILKQKSTSSFAMVSADSGSSSVSNNLTNIVVRDVQLLGTVATDGFSQFVYLLGLNGVTDAVIERVLFKGFRGDGFYLGSSYVAAVERHNRKITVRSCVFDGVNNQNRNGVSVSDCDGLLVDDCEFKNTTSSTMPGAIDMEPDAYAFPIIKNVLIRKCKFTNIGGNVGAVSLQVPSAVTTVPTNIIIEENEFSGYVGTGAFICFNTNRVPSSTSAKNDWKIIGNNCITGSLPFSLFDGNRVTFRDNYFQDCTVGGLIGYTGSTNQVYDLEFLNNRMVRCASSGSGCGLTIFTLNFGHFENNKWIDCGTGGAGTSNAIDFNSGSSTYIQFDNNEISSPTSKTLVAIQKEAAHTFSFTTNRYIGNNVNGLGNYFQAEESDYLQNAYTCVVTGSSSAGTGTYTDQYASYNRIGRQVYFRIKLTVSAGHTGTGMIQVGLPTLVQSSTNNAETTVALIAGGVATTGGHIGLINPALVVNSLGAIRCYYNGTGAVNQMLIPAGSFTVNVSGFYEMS